ncbi:MAG: hypothetical protein HY243_17850 [Proteobacteria bacterium]|nr:hypothetical protein [Pseudomonadota bacterium]
MSAFSIEEFMLSRLIRNTPIAIALAFAGSLPVVQAASLEPVTVAVPTIATLRSMTVPSSYIGSLVYVAEYGTGYGTGGGWFKINSASCTDDGGYNIALTGSHCAQRQGTERGFYATDFGAKTNDTSFDNSTVFNNAEVAACATNAPTKTIFVPRPNSYYLWSSSNPLHITCSGVRIIGIDTATFWVTNASLPAFLVNDYAHLSTSLTLENLSFETNQIAIPYGLYLKGISGNFRNIGFPKELAGATGFMNPIRVESDDSHLAISNTFYGLSIRTACSAFAIGVNMLSTASVNNYGITTERFFSGSIDACSGIGLQTDGGISVFGTIFEETPDICIKFVNPPSVVSDNTGSALINAYFEGCASYNINYAGNRVYWNSDIASNVGQTQKIGDNTRRNWHANAPYVSGYSERIFLADGTTTPDVTYGYNFYTNNSTSITITDFVMTKGDGTTGSCNQGRDFWVHLDGNTTIQSNSAIHTSTGANLNGSGWYSFACTTGQWQQRTLKAT